MAGKSKWYNWLLNPIGAAVNNATQNSDKGSVGSALNKALNPVKNIVDGVKQVFDGDAREKDVHRDIEQIAERAGMSLEEFLQLNPDYANRYYNAKNSFVDDILENPHVKSYVENVTGERDTAENEKNRQFQHDEAEIARNWEAEQAKAAREWDSIGAQMERAAAAGVNPISIAMQNGGINGSLGTSIPASPGIPAGSSGLMHNGVLDIASMVFNGIGTIAENRLKQTQADDITIMRQYNVAEKIANIDHVRQLCAGAGLSNAAQSIQNQWLDIMNQATYDGMLLENGVKRETIYEKRSVTKLNLQQVASIKQSMELNLREFNAKLPLELQLLESEINLNNMSVQDVYSEICMRYLQSIEQENRNRQSSAEADVAETESIIAKSTYEDAISEFHNNVVKSAAEAGISLYDYQYYGSNFKNFWDWTSKTQRAMFRNRKRTAQNEKLNQSTVLIPQNVGQ